MKKKIVCVSAIVIGMLIILGGISPSVCSKDIDTITIEVNRYYRKNTTTYTEVSAEEAKEIKQILINLNEAIENNDEAAISQYETILNNKGIFGDEYQEFFSKKTFSEKMNQNNNLLYPQYLKKTTADNISNILCYFNAIGTGGIFFMLALRFLEAMQQAISNASSLIEAFVILIALLPFFVMIYLFTHLIPFRILMPVGAISLTNGSMSSLGLQGYKRVKVGEDNYDVNVSWFTGITLNFIGSEELGGFLFVSGIAASVKEYYT